MTAEELIQKANETASNTEIAFCETGQMSMVKYYIQALSILIDDLTKENAQLLHKINNQQQIINALEEVE